MKWTHEAWGIWNETRECFEMAVLPYVVKPLLFDVQWRAVQEMATIKQEGATDEYRVVRVRESVEVIDDGEGGETAGQIRGE